jgi:predicted lipopolysaccharide heptosyltransferase III
MRVLLVRPREIGDVVFTTPAVHAVRRKFPSARIAYLVEPHAAPVVSHNPDLDEVIVAARSPSLQGIVTDLALGRRLRAKRFDLVIDFHGGPRASLLTWLSGAPQRIGYDVPGRSWMYTHRVARPRALRARHSVENQWDLLEPLGIARPDPGRDSVRMAVDPKSHDEVARRLSAAGVSGRDRLVVIHVSAGNPFRRWPIEHFVTVATALASDPSLRVIVTSGPSELDAADQVVSAARSALSPDAGGRIVSSGEFTLTELRALFDRTAVFIGGDSGPLHIAATTTVPIVGLYGPTTPARSAPWRDPSLPLVSLDAGELPCRPCDQRVCAPGDFRCLIRIQPERVVEAALRCLT